MKRIICMIVSVIMILSFASCTVGKKVTVEMDPETAGKFSGCMSIDEIMKDIRKIDIFQQMDVSGLTKEVVENKEDSLTDIYYKDSEGNTVYYTGEGYGETFFTHYMKSASGKDVKATFWYEGYKSVAIVTDDYSVHFTELGREKKYGARIVEVTSFISKDKILDEYISWCYFEDDGDKWMPDSAGIFENDGYYKYSSWEDSDSEGNVIPYFGGNLVYQKLEKAPGNDCSLLLDAEITFKPEFVAGHHSLGYYDSPDGQWYLTTDFVISFDSEEKKERFAEKYNLKETEKYGDEDNGINIRTGKLSVPVSKDCTGFDDFVSITEIDDYYYCSVTINENGEISDISRGGSYSFY